MEEGGNIIRNIGGLSSREAESIIIDASEGDLNFISPKGINFYGKDGGKKFGDYVEKEETEPQIAFSGWWSPDYEGMRNLERDSLNPKAYLEETVYFQLNVSDHIPVGTSITFQLWDKDVPYIPLFNDVKFDDKRVYKTAVVREINGQHRITIELYLSPKWHNDVIQDQKGSFDACLEFYWTWKYHNQYWNSNDNVLNVYVSKTTLFIKPAISDPRYGLPEIYSNNGSIILYAIDKLPDGTVKKFSMIKLRTITTFKFQADINKFKREIYKEAINLDTNKLESASYAVEEGATFFKTNKNASQMYIDEAITEIPIDGRGQVAVKNFGIKTVKFAKEAAKYYAQFEVLKEMKEMIPMLSSNEKFNMPSLSTFVGFIPQLEVFAFGVEVIGWMVKGSLKESEEVVNESMWADWQNAKGKGLKYALKFVEQPWAIERGFNFIYVSNKMVNKLLKGDFKTLDELEKLREKLRIDEYEEYQSTLLYTVFYTSIYNEEIEKDIVLIDCLFINQ